MRWRWDQGRLDYFKYDNIVSIAQVLQFVNNIDLRTAESDPLRSELAAKTGLPFAPTHYRVWRNYGRVFACSLLATRIHNRLVTTDICARIAEGHGIEFSVDDYLSLFIRRFSYPFPGFQGYNTSDQQIFPICAVLRRLISLFGLNKTPSVSLADVFSYIIGNNCTGTESLDFYAGLKPTDRTPHGDERRQVRELLIFCSQLNFLKWYRDSIFLDLDYNDEESFNSLLQLATPDILARVSSPEAQLLRLGSLEVDRKEVAITIHTRETPMDVIFTEGRQTRVTHLRTERSPRLRRIYFDIIAPPYQCDMCDTNLSVRYPWTDNLLELHHLLPLSSSLTISSKGTSIDDVTPLCPNCHKGIHVYYSTFFKVSGLEDFETKEQAKEIYSEAKQKVVL